MEKAILAFFLLSTIPPIARSDEHERRLYDSLLRDYNTLERPVENNSQPVQVKLQIVLNQIIDVDEKNQIVQTNIWMKYEWNDTYLRWDPADFGGVADVRIPMGRIWRPDILLYNSVDSNFDTTYGVNHVVYNSGLVNWLPPGIVKSSCTINIKWFPFDEQECYFKFSSWTYGSFKLNLSILDDGWDMSVYLENGEWQLLSRRAFGYLSFEDPLCWIQEYYVQRQESLYDCCPDPYVNVFFYFVIRRRTLYYGFNMIIPSLIVSLMTLLGFALPVESGEKVTLEITILLSVCVFLGMVASMTPPTSEALPLIGIFFSCNIILVALSVVCSVVVLNFHYRTPDTHTMSPMLRNIMLNWLPWLLMMKRPGHKFTRFSLFKSQKPAQHIINGGGQYYDDDNLLKKLNPQHQQTQQQQQQQNDSSSFLAFNHVGVGRCVNEDDAKPLGRVKRLYSPDLEERLKMSLHNATNGTQSMDQGMMSMLLTMQQVYSEVKFIAQRMEREDEIQDAKNDWRFAAMVVDRLCLYIFSVLIIVSTCGIFFSAPYLVA